MGLLLSSESFTFISMCAHYFPAGKSPKEAAEDGLRLMAMKVGGIGGVIVLNKEGDIGIHFSSEGMSWSYISSDDKTNIHYGIYRDEHKILGITAHEERLKTHQ